MGTIVIVVYKPRDGKAAELEELVANHVPILRHEGLVTERQPVIMRASDGSVIEVFEWLSPTAIDDAHNNERVQALWERFEQVCTYKRPDTIPEFQQIFSAFESIN